MYVFFLGLIPQGIRPSQHRTALPSVIASGLSQASREKEGAYTLCNGMDGTREHYAK